MVLKENWCNQCGLCCKYFDVDVSKEELDRIHEALSPAEQKEFMKQVRQIDDDTWHWRNPCYFLRKAGDKYECRIHAVKPKMCGDWSETQCKAFLKRLLDPEDTLDPNAEGTPQDWDTYGTGTGHYDRLADGSDDTGVETAVEEENDYVNIENMAVTPESINWVEIHIRARSLNGEKGGEVLWIGDKYGVDERFTSNIIVDRTTYTEYTTGQYTTQPDGVSAWTKAAVDGLQVGVRSISVGTGETIRVSKIWAVVNYEALTPGSTDLQSTFTIQKPGSDENSSTFVVQRPGESDNSSTFIIQKPGESDCSSNFVVQQPGTADLSGKFVIAESGEANLSSTLVVQQLGEADLSSTLTVVGVGEADLSSQFVVSISGSVDLTSQFTVQQPGEANLSSAVVVQQLGEEDLSSNVIIQQPGSRDLQSTFIVGAGFADLSSTFTIEAFYIIDVVCSPKYVRRTGTYTSELRCDWHDEADLAASAYLCLFWVREPDNVTTHGPYTGTIVKEGSKEYNATFDIDPEATWPLGDYDLQAKVYK